MKIEITNAVDIYDIATAFFDADIDAQCDFLNEIGRKYDCYAQYEYLDTASNLDDYGKSFIKRLYEIIKHNETKGL